MATSLISMVALGFAAVYSTSQSFMASAITSSDLQGDAAFALRHMSQMLRSATGAGVDGVTGGLSLTVPPPGSYMTATPPVTTVYYHDSNTGNLVWIPTVAARGTTMILARNVTTFQAVDLGGGPVGNATHVVRVTIATFHNNRTVVLSTSMNMRGKA